MRIPQGKAKEIQNRTALQQKETKYGVKAQTLTRNQNIQIESRIKNLSNRINLTKLN